MEVVLDSNSTREEMLLRMMTQYENTLLRMCYVYLRDASLAEDAVQETFVKVYKSLSSFREASSEKTWVMRIAINTCKDMRRLAWFRYVDRSVTLDDLPEAAAAYSIEDDLLTIEIMRLPRKLIEVVLLYYYHGMTVSEIGKSLGISAPSVSTRLKRARSKLRTALEGGHPHGSSGKL